LASADGHRLLYEQLDTEISNVMLVEGLPIYRFAPKACEPIAQGKSCFCAVLTM
jgi:hypothetical protein